LCGHNFRGKLHIFIRKTFTRFKIGQTTTPVLLLLFLIFTLRGAIYFAKPFDGNQSKLKAGKKIALKICGKSGAISENL
jgi:hypothetical protein